MISIYSTAAHPELWMNFYKSIGETAIDFECVFVGPNAPAYKLPDNFRHIQTNVKPPQCLEIGLRECKGELCMNVADDLWFGTPQPLEKMLQTYRELNDPKGMVSAKFTIIQDPWQRATHRFFWTDPNSPMIPVCGLSRTQFLRDLGGYDINFVCLFSDMDVAMRIHEAGGQIVLADVLLYEDRDKGSRPSLFNTGFIHIDRGLLNDLWTDGNQTNSNEYLTGIMRKTRKRPVQSFSDENILIASQGPKGPWA